MATKKNRKQGPKKNSSSQRTLERERAGLIGKMIKSITGGLIGVTLTGLFSVVVLAFVIKAFLASEAMAHQLLNSAITIAGTTLGAVLGYFLGKNNSGKSSD